MIGIYQNILNAIKDNQKLLAVLIDPDKFRLENVEAFITKVNCSIATHIFIGGSEVEDRTTGQLVERIKSYTDLPLVLFPGDENQLTDKADALLFLSLISGRNPDYLIEKHINVVPKLNTMSLEVIPTGYILVENGIETSVERISQTTPLPRNNVELIVNTAKAGEYLGMKLLYLEAGSGAKAPIDAAIISRVKTQLKIPLIVGGGVKSKAALDRAYTAGADLVVIGTAFEKDETFFNEISKPKKS